MQPVDFREFSCKECAQACDLGFDFSMAFQPIVDISSRTVFAVEALVRGTNGEGAADVFKHVNESNRYRFDQSCRVKAIRLAASLGVQSFLCINFLPNAIYKPELCIRTTLAAAQTYGFDQTKIIFEFTENERIFDQAHLLNIINHYQEIGFQTAIDDFGSGYNGLAQLADLKTNFTKIDMELIRHIDQDSARQTIVRHMTRMLEALGQTVIAEGIETAAEYEMLKSMGITLFQGYLFAKPAFESIPEIHWQD
ncbi:EAL domain, c-di-GMP-specific phosphodiesterase class I (or its enzymatically inactive variant) [Marinomonas fungiae]|uniref:EAL domain, c-di-GMP-specific phosphodiesterase class I (Or its enzymatically inactive variant) n=2 Tax=Marinomonas fungiae TaxID=1137284 RepID=A0A0K6IIK8_9GAMM|nr:EAL domain, c-di-GMP-specific phosphodiesterase class I (or its enzymatically inactive variant) [Marinomonas fungiae]